MKDSTSVRKKACAKATSAAVGCILNSVSRGGGGGNAIYVPYGDVPPIRVYFLAFRIRDRVSFFEPDSKTGCQICKINPSQGAYSQYCLASSRWF